MKKLSLLIVCSLVVGACATASLTTKGQQVEMIQQMTRTDCENLGPVFGKGGGWFGGGWITDEKLMEYASNDLRNKAAAKGATHVVFSPHQMGHTSGEHGGTTSTATFSGVAYKCPSQVQPPVGATAVSPPVQDPGTDANNPVDSVENKKETP